MEPQEDKEITRHLAAIHWQNLQVIAEPDPTRTRVPRVLVQDRTIQQRDLQGLRDFCTPLEAKYGVDNGRCGC